METYAKMEYCYNRLRSFQVPRQSFSRHRVFFSFYRNAKARPCTSRSEKGVKQAKVDRSRHLSVCEIAINETKSLPIYLTPATLSLLSPPNVSTPRLRRLSSPLHTLISLASSILEVDTSPFVVCPKLLFYLLIYISPLPDRRGGKRVKEAEPSPLFHISLFTSGWCRLRRTFLITRCRL